MDQQAGWSNSHPVSLTAAGLGSRKNTKNTLAGDCIQMCVFDHKM